MVCHMMRNEGRKINHKRVERIWREEGLKLPQKQEKKRRLWLADGSCVRLRPEHKNHVWSYDFVEDRTMDGRKVRWLNIIDEYERECLASVPRRSWRNTDVTTATARSSTARTLRRHTISDKARCVGGAALEAYLYFLRQRDVSSFD